MATLGTAYVQIVPSAQGIKGAITNVLSGEADAAGAATGASLGSKVVAFAKKAIVAGAIGKVVKDALMEGAELEQLKGGVEKIFDGANISQIFKDANNAYKDLNLSANDYLSTITNVGATFASTMGDQKGYDVARAGMLAVSDFATGTGKDVGLLNEKFQMISRSTSSYQSIADQFAGLLPQTSSDFLAQAQAAGFLGDQYTSLTEVPVAEYQEALVKMMQKGTEEMGLAGNTAAETENTFSGSFAAMKASWDNLLGALTSGENVGQAMTNLATSASTFFFGNFLPMIGTLVKSLPSAILAFLQTGLPLLVSGISSLINSVMVQIKSLADGITASSVAEWATTTLPQIIAAGTQLIGGLVQTLITNIPQILAAIVQIGVSVAAGLLSAIGNAMAPAKAALIAKWSEIKADAQAAWNAIKSAASTAWNAVKTAITNPIDTLKSGLSEKWNSIKSAASTAWEKIKSAMTKPIETAKTTIEGIIKKVKGFFPISIGNVMNNLKLPHFSISGKFSINPPSVPKFSISWYRKGGIIPDAAVFGAVGMGEAGPEAILPLDPFWKKLDEITNNAQSGNTVNIYINGSDKDPKQIAEEVKRVLIKETNNRRLAWQ